MTDQELKELQIHTLRGDIQQLGMETWFNELGIRNTLFYRYLKPWGYLTRSEFDAILSEEYEKVEDWRSRQSNANSSEIMRNRKTRTPPDEHLWQKVETLPNQVWARRGKPQKNEEDTHMTVRDLMEMLEEVDPDIEVRIAYQPHYPMSAGATFIKVATGNTRSGRTAQFLHICQNPAGGNEYAPEGIFDDDDYE